MGCVDEEVVAVLKEIRDEAKQTNARLDQTNSRLDSLEKRVTEGFDTLGRRQVESELRLATEVIALADVTRDVRDLFARRLDDHHLVVDLAKRVEILETRR